MNKPLALLFHDAHVITQRLIELGGEMNDEGMDWLLEIQDKNMDVIGEKIDKYAFLIDRFQTEKAFFDEKAKMYSKISKSFTKISERLTDTIKEGMIKGEIKEIKGKEARYVLSNCAPRLVIEDENKLPSDMMMQVTEVVPDKDKIKSALGDGFPVEGAKLEGGYRLTKYLAKE